ncbi:hypothetical protein PybrP1_008818 [[Pythium] brassicae (nom. inval.)]|nr:hypothetical protein PybrP1_008818 [[Pythium] brassicae (nom. inval.)]
MGGSTSSLHFENVELSPQKEPVVAINRRFCEEETLTLQQRTRFLQCGTTFVNAHTGGTRFEVKGKLFSCRKTLFDGSLSPIVNYNGKWFSPIVSVRAGDDHTSDVVLQIHAKYHWRLKTELRVEFDDIVSGKHYELGFEGHWRHRRGHIWLIKDRDGEREPVAKIHRPNGVSAGNIGCGQSIESIRAITTPGYKPKPQAPPRALTPASGVAGYGVADLMRAAANPAYRPKTPQFGAALSTSCGQIVVIHARFCSPVAVTLHLRETFFSLSGDSFSVKEVPSGAVRFRVSGAAFSIREKKTLLDANSVAIATMKEKLLAVMPSYNVYASDSSAGSPLFEIHCKVTLIATDLRVSFVNRATGARCSMGLDGDWLSRKATIWAESSGGRKEVVGRVYRPLMAARNLLLDTQDYYLQAAPNVDLALLTLICVVLDEAAAGRD